MSNLTEVLRAAAGEASTPSRAPNFADVRRRAHRKTRQRQVVAGGVGALLVGGAVLAGPQLLADPEDISTAGTPTHGPNGPLTEVPPEFRTACGNPGVTVRVEGPLPLRISRAACDLRGVVLFYRSQTELVPDPRHPHATVGSRAIRSFVVSVNPSTGDVLLTEP